MVNPPVLVTFAGRSGTGKTTLARTLASDLRAAYLRIDAIETALVRARVAEGPVGAGGYVIAHAIARGNLLLGTTVVVDAVNPVSDARRGWRDLALECDVPLVVFETTLTDRDEHRRRVSARRPDLADQSVPTWEQVEACDYEIWDCERDGPRIAIDMADTELALATVRSLLGR